LKAAPGHALHAGLKQTATRVRTLREPVVPTRRKI